MSCTYWSFEQSHVLQSGKSCTAKNAQGERGRGLHFRERTGFALPYPPF